MSGFENFIFFKICAQFLYKNVYICRINSYGISSLPVCLTSCEMVLLFVCPAMYRRAGICLLVRLTACLCDEKCHSLFTHRF